MRSLELNHDISVPRAIISWVTKEGDLYIGRTYMQNVAQNRMMIIKTGWQLHIPCWLQMDGLQGSPASHKSNYVY